MVGGAKHYLDAQALFSRFTVLDSRPFMEAQARRILIRHSEQGYRWVKSQTEDGQPIDALLEANLALYPEKLKSPPLQVDALESDPAQMELFDSTPYLTAQPVA
jgi:hypothetical protein